MCKGVVVLWYFHPFIIVINISTASFVQNNIYFCDIGSSVAGSTVHS